MPNEAKSRSRPGGRSLMTSRSARSASRARAPSACSRRMTFCRYKVIDPYDRAAALHHLRRAVPPQYQQFKRAHRADPHRHAAGICAVPDRGAPRRAASRRTSTPSRRWPISTARAEEPRARRPRAEERGRELHRAHAGGRRADRRWRPKWRRCGRAIRCSKTTSPRSNARRAENPSRRQATSRHERRAAARLHHRPSTGQPPHGSLGVKVLQRMAADATNVGGRERRVRLSMSLLSVVQDVCEVVGVERLPTVFSNLNITRTQQEMLALRQRDGAAHRLRHPRLDRADRHRHIHRRRCHHWLPAAGGLSAHAG